MAIREQEATLHYVKEADAPIRLFSSTEFAKSKVHILAVEQEQESLICSAKSVELLHKPLYGIIEFHNQRWRIKRQTNLYGSPSYDVEFICERIA